PPPPSAISPLSLHDALPICLSRSAVASAVVAGALWCARAAPLSLLVPAAVFSVPGYFALLVLFGAFTREEREFLRGMLQRRGRRSEEHTSELQSLRHLVCRL